MWQIYRRIFTTVNVSHGNVLGDFGHQVVKEKEGSGRLEGIDN